MRIIVATLICNLALIGLVCGAQTDENKREKKKQTQTAQSVAQPARHPAKTASGGQNAKKGQTLTRTYQPQKGNKRQTSPTTQVQKGKKSQPSVGSNEGRKGNRGQASTGAYDREKAKKGETTTAFQGKKGKKNQTYVERQTGKAARGGDVPRSGKSTEATAAKTAKTAAKGKAASGKPFKPQHFSVAKQPNTAKAPAVKFQQGRHLEGSQNWHGQQYSVFRNYKEEWHDKNWWHNHHNRIVFVFGAPYYWNAGYWFPAWGYNPNAYYAWNGPIYAYNNLPPDQVTANVQAALQQQGYYHGDVDGLIGPLTRGAIADYQRDHGLYITSAIDQPTLRSLGMA